MKLLPLMLAMLGLSVMVSYTTSAVVEPQAATSPRLDYVRQRLTMAMRVLLVDKEHAQWTAGQKLQTARRYVKRVLRQFLNGGVSLRLHTMQHPAVKDMIAVLDGMAQALKQTTLSEKELHHWAREIATLSVNLADMPGLVKYMETFASEAPFQPEQLAFYDGYHDRLIDEEFDVSAEKRVKTRFPLWHSLMTRLLRLGEAVSGVKTIMSGSPSKPDAAMAQVNGICNILNIIRDEIPLKASFQKLHTQFCQHFKNELFTEGDALESSMVNLQIMVASSWRAMHENSGRFYIEWQKYGRCTLHSLNNLLQKDLYTPQDMEKIGLVVLGAGTHSHDGFFSEAILYALYRRNMDVHVLSDLSKFSADTIPDNVVGLLVFKEKHIFAIKRHTAPDGTSEQWINMNGIHVPQRVLNSREQLLVFLKTASEKDAIVITLVTQSKGDVSTRTTGDLDRDLEQLQAEKFPSDGVNRDATPAIAGPIRTCISTLVEKIFRNAFTDSLSVDQVTGDWQRCQQSIQNVSSQLSVITRIQLQVLHLYFLRLLKLYQSLDKAHWRAGAITLLYYSAMVFSNKNAYQYNQVVEQSKNGMSSWMRRTLLGYFVRPQMSDAQTLLQSCLTERGTCKLSLISGLKLNAQAIYLRIEAFQQPVTEMLAIALLDTSTGLWSVLVPNDGPSDRTAVSWKRIEFTDQRREQFVPDVSEFLKQCSQCAAMGLWPVQKSTPHKS